MVASEWINETAGQTRFGYGNSTNEMSSGNAQTAAFSQSIGGSLLKVFLIKFPMPPERFGNADHRFRNVVG